MGYGHSYAAVGKHFAGCGHSYAIIRKHFMDCGHLDAAVGDSDGNCRPLSAAVGKHWGDSGGQIAHLLLYFVNSRRTFALVEAFSGM